MLDVSNKIIWKSKCGEFRFSLKWKFNSCTISVSLMAFWLLSRNSLNATCCRDIMRCRTTKRRFPRSLKVIEMPWQFIVNCFYREFKVCQEFSSQLRYLFSLQEIHTTTICCFKTRGQVPDDLLLVVSYTPLGRVYKSIEWIGTIGPSLVLQRTLPYIARGTFFPYPLQ